MANTMLLAEAFRYPAPGRVETLRAAIPQVTGDVQVRYAAFCSKIEKLSLSEWEELYTRTWDLNPVAAPYIGYQTWGENYQRGNFMAALNHALLEANIDLDGELPDHLIPVLRYLGAVTVPLAELSEIMPAAIERITAALQKADPSNPYLYLLEGIQKTLMAAPKGDQPHAGH